MNLKRIPTDALQSELKRRQDAARTLHERRETLAHELAAVDRELALLGSEVRVEPAGKSALSDGKRRRARNKLSLGDALAQAMELRAVVSPSEAAELVRSNGYKTHSKNFGMMVSNTLSKDERFQRLSRGQYERVA